MTDTTTLIQRLSDEADLCRNDGATDIAKLLDAAVMEVEGTHALTSDEKAVRARDDANSWKSTQRREERHAA